MIRIGQRLHDERIRKGLSLVDVERATRIKSAFLTAIERGEYQRLPSSAYAHGFVANYAQYLGVPKREALALFKREFDEEKEFRVLPEGMAKRQEFPIYRLRIQQTVVVLGVIFLALMGYILFQYRYALFNPPLSISSPKEGSSITGDITVKGKTDPGAIVYVNSDPVSVADSGDFSKKVTAFVGKTTITVIAKNRLGKETTAVRHVEIK